MLELCFITDRSNFLFLNLILKDSLHKPDSSVIQDITCTAVSFQATSSCGDVSRV